MLVHRLLSRLPRCSTKTQFPTSAAAQYAFLGPLGIPQPALGDWLARTSSAARGPPCGTTRADDRQVFAVIIAPTGRRRPAGQLLPSALLHFCCSSSPAAAPRNRMIDLPRSRLGPAEGGTWEPTERRGAQHERLESIRGDQLLPPPSAPARLSASSRGVRFSLAAHDRQRGRPLRSSPTT